MKLISTIPSPELSHQVFWGEIAPCEHMVQLYNDEAPFMDALEGFIAGGLKAGESTIVIATPTHREILAERLRFRGIDLLAVEATDQYIALDAEATLAKFMSGESPDPERFRQLVDGLLTRAKVGGRRVRAFGEMVALLWARGDNAATLQLEHLWHGLCRSEVFALLCAYPKSGFTQATEASISQICAAHSRVVS